VVGNTLDKVGIHKIDTGDARLIAQRCYKNSIHEEEIVKEIIKDYLSKGIIRESQSPWASPIVVVKKKN
jgi:hypothetical protein